MNNRRKPIRHEDTVFAPKAKALPAATQDALQCLPLLAFTLGLLCAALMGI